MKMNDGYDIVMLVVCSTLFHIRTHLSLCLKIFIVMEPWNILEIQKIDKLLCLIFQFLNIPLMFDDIRKGGTIVIHEQS